jgi:hypothetical protein
MISPITTGLAKADWIWFGAQKLIIASASLIKKRVKQKRITFDQTISLVNAKCRRKKGANIVNHEAFTEVLQNRHGSATIPAIPDRLIPFIEVKMASHISGTCDTKLYKTRARPNGGKRGRRGRDRTRAQLRNESGREKNKARGSETE